MHCAALVGVFVVVAMQDSQRANVTPPHEININNKN
jgi:hypothetical protein